MYDEKDPQLLELHYKAKQAVAHPTDVQKFMEYAAAAPARLILGILEKYRDVSVYADRAAQKQKWLDVKDGVPTGRVLLYVTPKDGSPGIATGRFASDGTAYVDFGTPVLATLYRHLPEMPRPQKKEAS